MTQGNTSELAKHLYEVERLPVGEIARRLNITPGGVSNALRRAGIPSANPKRPRAAVRPPKEKRREPDPHGTPRDPCSFCGVRPEHHAEFGCKRWRRL